MEDLWVKMLITSILQTLLKDNSEHERKCSVTKQLIITCSGCLNRLRSLICPQIPRLTHFDTLTPVQTLIMAKSPTAATFSDVIFTLKYKTTCSLLSWVGWEILCYGLNLVSWDFHINIHPWSSLRDLWASWCRLLSVDVSKLIWVSQQWQHP